LRVWWGKLFSEKTSSGLNKIPDKPEVPVYKINVYFVIPVIDHILILLSALPVIITFADGE
jgi:hypothetical protein